PVRGAGARLRELRDAGGGQDRGADRVRVGTARHCVVSMGRIGLMTGQPIGSASFAVVTHPDDGGGRPAPALRWEFSRCARAASSAMLGGGISACRWVINAHVRADYARTDPAVHLREIAAAAGLDPDEGVGLLTAARVENAASAVDSGARCDATV